MAPTARLPPKKDVALALLEQASMYVHLDPRAEAVQVPTWFKKQPQLVLQVGLNMAVPIPDLHVDEHGLSCTLSFNRSPFFCMIPWPAIFALVGENGQAMVWAEDVPAEVAAQAQAQKAPEKPRPHLRSVGADDQAAAADKAVDEPAAKLTDKKLASKPGKTKVDAAKAAAEGTKRASKASPRPKLEPDKEPKATPPKSLARLPANPKVRAKKGASAPVPASRPPTGEARPAPVPAKKAAQPKPEAAAADTEHGSKPKRELPPYLRVVK